jgi:hypothetical protein
MLSNMYITLQFEATTEIFVEVRPYICHGRHPVLSHLPLLEKLESDTIWIEPNNIHGQFFVAKDMTIVANKDKYLCFHKRKMYKTEVETELDQEA